MERDSKISIILKLKNYYIHNRKPFNKKNFLSASRESPIATYFSGYFGITEDVVGYSPEFWEDVQKFYDDEKNYSSKGLSIIGYKNFGELLVKYSIQ